VLRISFGNSLRSLLTVSSSGAIGSHEHGKNPKGETMSTPDQAPGYDGEPTCTQEEYDEYLRWLKETEPPAS
jgi:hypothetical protein